MNLVIFFIGLSFFKTAQAIEPPTLDLHQTVEMALSHAPSVLQAQETLTIRELEESSAWFKFFPKLEATGTHGISKTSPASTTDPWASSLSVTLTETLYDNGASHTRHQIAKQKTAIARTELERARAEIALAVATEFYKFSQNTKLLGILEEHAKLISRFLGIVTQHYKQGIKTKKDYLKFKSQQQRTDLDLLLIRNTIKTSENEMRRQMGVTTSEATFKAIDTKSDVAGFSVPTLDLKKHYDFIITKGQREVDEAQTELVRREAWPRLTLSAGASYSNSNYLGSTSSFGSNAVWSGTALLKIDIALWDWNTRGRDVEIAARTQRINELERGRQLRETETTAEKAHLDLESARKSLDLSRELLQMESESATILEEEYRAGRIQYLDFLTGLGDLLSARQRQVTTFFEYQSQKLKVLYHAGVLDVDHLE